MSTLIYRSDLIRNTYDTVQCWCGNTSKNKGFELLYDIDQSILFLTERPIYGVILYGCKKCGRIFIYFNHPTERFIKCVGVLKHHRLNASELEGIRSK